MSVTGTITIGGITIGGAGPAVAPGYDLIAAGVSSRVRRRDTVTSPWVDGDREIASVRGAVTYQVELQCVGTTWSSACALMDAVIAVVEQRAWTLTETLDGRTETYSCRAAQQIDCPIERTLLINSRRTMTITIPVRRTS